MELESTDHQRLLRDGVLRPPEKTMRKMVPRRIRIVAERAYLWRGWRGERRTGQDAPALGEPGAAVA